MANTGIFDFSLIDVTHQEITDPRVSASFFRAQDSETILRVPAFAHPPRRRLEMPAFPQAHNLFGFVSASRYRMRETGFFTLTAGGPPVVRNLTVLRDPSRWEARFTRWKRLTEDADPLKSVLARSNSVRVKDGAALGRFAEDDYDAADGPPTLLAKATLLNIFTKMSRIPIPGGRRPWFSFVKEILVIDRERFVAIAQPGMAEVVRGILDNIDDHEDYKAAGAGLHAGNIPAGFKVMKRDMFSVKTREDKGNLQFTLSPALDADGRDVLLLDADIDENGQWLRHVGDVFKHKLTGGTHPYDVHELLAFEDKSWPFGYELV